MSSQTHAQLLEQHGEALYLAARVLTQSPYVLDDRQRGAYIVPARALADLVPDLHAIVRALTEAE